MDPLTGAAIAKTASKAAKGVEGQTEGLLKRVLGPAADEIGEALARYSSFRLRNVGRIVEKADQKSSADGEVPPRVAHRILDDGSYCDDELMAEYLGGVMAASKTPGGRDDRGVSWSATVSDMSSLQIRAHFLLYREWARLLRGRPDLQLGLTADRESVDIHIELAHFLEAIVKGSDVPHLEALNHAIQGLRRLGLLEKQFAWGKVAEMPGYEGPFASALVVGLSYQGLELYGWAQGVPGLSFQDFATRAQVFAEDEIPPLTMIAFPKLKPPSDGNRPGS